MMDFDGKTLREWLMMPEPLRCIAVAQEGEVFVAEATKVHRFNAKFEHIGAWGDPGEGQGEFMTITDMVVSEPYVLVADAGHRCVHRFEFDGQFVNDLGRRDTKADYPGIICPSPHLGVAVDAQRRIYVTNPGMLRIEVFSRIGTLTGFWGQPSAQIYKPDGFFGCCNPTRVAVLPDGRIVTAEKIAARVKVHTPDGKLLALIGPEHFTAKTIHLDIAVDSQSRISALDSASGKVMIFGEASQ